MKIAIIDYKCGNIASLKNAIEYLGFDVEVTKTANGIKSITQNEIIKKATVTVRKTLASAFHGFK